MSAIQVIQGFMPLIQNAADLVATFTGTDDEARGDSTIQQALEVIGTLAPLVDSFSRGANITPEQVRSALAGMGPALADFDAEIAKQGG
jgi:hypothetical protein